jgi:DNA-directed RNA polymerase specialized sigma subunit|tara:strand:- start:3511 stop:4212 length:702 start_codon:yes stop_codon:yes gene_type:complete
MKKKRLTRKRRNKKEKRDYFTEVHQEAIVRYAQTTDLKERDQLYEKLIGPAFNEMVDKIVYTYKFTNLANIDDLKSECKIWLTTILNKFDPEKGSKAFSYFSVITKNWFIHKVKHNSIRLKREVYFEEVADLDEMKNLVTHNDYHDLREKKEFWDSLGKEIDVWESEAVKSNEKRVVEAIRIILSEPEDIEIFNKKAIYLYLREITGLNTKQIVNSLNKVRAKYKLFKEGWDL